MSDMERRMARMEAAIVALAELVSGVDRKLDVLVEALASEEQEAEVPARDLDGELLPADRDIWSPL